MATRFLSTITVALGLSFYLQYSPAGATPIGSRFRSLIPGPGVKLSTIILAGHTLFSAAGANSAWLLGSAMVAGGNKGCPLSEVYIAFSDRAPIVNGGSPPHVLKVSALHFLS
jgi:hypothetical protein